MLVSVGASPLCAQTPPQGNAQVNAPQDPATQKTVPDAAPEDSKPLLFQAKPGEYAIYCDTTFGAPVYIGICATGGNNLLIRLYESETKNLLIVMHSFYVKGHDVDPGSIDPIYGSFASSPAAGKVLAIVYDWVNAWLHSSGRFATEPDYEINEYVPFHFAYWIPVLQMESAGAAKLVTAGVAESGEDPAFFGYTGEEQAKDGPSTAIPKSSPVAVTLGGMDFQLDGNWKAGSDGAWRLSKIPNEDAFCSAETVDLGAFGPSEKFDTFDLIKLYLLHPYPAGELLAGSVKLFAKGDYPCLYYRVYDAGTKQVSVQFRMFVPTGGTELSVVSLGVAGSLYDGNRDYFNSILGIQF